MKVEDRRFSALYASFLLMKFLQVKRYRIILVSASYIFCVNKVWESQTLVVFKGCLGVIYFKLRIKLLISDFGCLITLRIFFWVLFYFMIYSEEKMSRPMDNNHPVGAGISTPLQPGVVHNG